MAICEHITASGAPLLRMGSDEERGVGMIENLEVEKKFRICEEHVGCLIQVLGEMSFYCASSAMPTDVPLERQGDWTRRLRSQEGAFIYSEKLLLESSKGLKVKREREEVVPAERANLLLAGRLKGHNPVIKHRQTFGGQFRGRQITVCIDQVLKGLGGKSRFFWEVEKVVLSAKEIEAAKEDVLGLAKILRKKIHIHEEKCACKVEVRSYRRMSKKQ